MNYIPLKAGTFQMGDTENRGFIEDHESPCVIKEVQAFEVAETTVTNEEFKRFVDETGYQTTAELIGDSYVFHLLVSPEKRENYSHVSGSPWWLLVPGACWKHPFGPESSIENLLNHPVVHVSLKDALAESGLGFNFQPKHSGNMRRVVERPLSIHGEKNLNKMENTMRILGKESFQIKIVN